VILIDTHVVLWLAFEPNRVSAAARHEIENARTNGTGVAISDISLLELTTLEGKGRFQTGIGLDAFLQGVTAKFTTVPITVRACCMIPKLPSAYPKDPADRIIGATALAEGIPLVTADEKIRKAKAFETIW
jgi:PIN domain nuclease of toxin-antitoxin system